MQQTINEIQENKLNQKPDFTNNEGVAVWKKHSEKTGKDYLTIKLPLGLGITNVFIPKENN